MFIRSLPFFSLFPSRNSYLGTQQVLLPPPEYVLWVELRQQFFFQSKDTLIPRTIVFPPAHIYG